MWSDSIYIKVQQAALNYGLNNTFKGSNYNEKLNDYHKCQERWLFLGQFFSNFTSESPGGLIKHRF